MSGGPPADITSLSYVLERDPASPLFYDLALACAEGERWADAERILRAGLAFHPEHLRAKVLLGQALVRLGEAAGAKEALEAAASLLSEVAGRLYPALAALCEEAGDLALGLKYLELGAAHGALSTEGEARRSRLSARVKAEALGRAEGEARRLMEQGRAEEAALLLREALTRHPQEAALEERLRQAEDQAVREREAGQMINLLQGWLSNISPGAPK